MAYSHIAHNCIIGNWVTMANHATLAGHIEVEDHVIIGGMTPIHQFVRIGCHAMVGGMSRITHDIPPYTIGAGIPYKFGGLNLVGLKRKGFSLDVRSQLSRCFRYVYRSQLHLDEALEKIEKELPSIDEVNHWLQFCKNSKRGLIGLQGSMVVGEEELLLEEEVIQR
jgi:UDP-N-acetylglucosamine acyltransferase